MTASFAAALERREDGQLLLTWDSASVGTSTLRVEVGRDPGKFGGPAVSVDGHRGEMVVPALPGRTYVRLTSREESVIVAERRVPVPGTLNFRDVGGYPTRDGGWVRWGLLYRSEALDALEDEGASALEDLGARTVFDLRRPSERPAVMSSTKLDAISIPIGGEAIGEAEFANAIVSGQLSPPVTEHLVAAYYDFVQDWGSSFVALLESLAQREKLPAIVHCSAGKDRTGLVVALLLSALGVDRESVLDDYELTTRLRSGAKIDEMRPMFASHGLDVEDYRILYEAPRHVLAEMLDHIDERFGGVESYLLGNGLESAALGRLRSIFVDA